MANEWKRGTFTYDAVGLAHTAQNIINGFTSFMTQANWEVPAWASNTLDRYFTRIDYGTSDVWKFNGDGPDQKGGIHIKWNSGSSRIEITAFLENSAGTGAQVETPSGNAIYISVDNTAPNNYLLIGGEHGLYVESGRDGINNNLGQGFVATFLPVDEFYGAKDTQRKWTAQGFCCDLTGNLKFSTLRTSVYVTNDGSSRAFTSYLNPNVARGTNSLYTNTQADGRLGKLSHRKAIFGQGGATSNGSGLDGYCTFGSSYLSALNNSRYVISQLLFAPTLFANDAAAAINTSVLGTATTGTGSLGQGAIIDPTAYWRQVKKFSQVQYDLTAWANITDAVTSTPYRVVGVADGGRTAKLGVEWPSSGNVLTIAL